MSSRSFRFLRLTAALGLGLSLVLTGCGEDPNASSAAGSSSSEWISETNDSSSSASTDRSAEARESERAEDGRGDDVSEESARESEEAARETEEAARESEKAEASAAAEREAEQAAASRKAEESAAAEREAEQAAAQQREREAAEKKATEAKAAEQKTAEQAVATDAAQAAAPAPSQASAKPASPAYVDGERGIVVSVTDGDTLRIRINGVEERVRLLNIDTPETKHPSHGVQCLGPESTAALKSLVAPGQPVTLRYDKERRDRYDRVLAGVWVGDTFVNAEMARLGLGEPVIFQPNVRFYNEVHAAWQEAKAAGRGQFASGLGCTPGTESAPAQAAPAPQQFAAPASKPAAAPAPAPAPASKPAAAPAPAPAPKPAPAAGGSGPVAGNTATRTCPASHPVKANDNSGIYHLPHNQAYSQTNARNCYATAAAAQAAGYRAAKR
ncbi:thermonuclease family protein [Micrococcus lylae]|uniref:thermonuclease family protein n=1 Tax=Micrococcus lylae TaxID=1273 RepID=UPI0021A64ACD|nr:thermonuclease family protein [Micrococcus lylae]MCT2007879.1 thermonuclease family protein [Micrococcus lylae]MCT2071601.1 thermonuclease family protein [Micrococcus lylae]